MEVTLTEDEFLAIYDTFAAHYLEGGDILTAEGDEFRTLVETEERAWRVVQKIHDRYYNAM